MIKASPLKDPAKIAAGGYNYDFVVSRQEIVKCVICRIPSKEPHLSECCGHTFCASCLQQYKATPSVASGIIRCPKCNASDQPRLFPTNRLTEKSARSLKVYCNNKARGCTWQGEINNISRHVENSDGCPYQDVKCTYKCRKTLQRQHLVDHMTSKCPRRKVNCQYCHINGEWKIIEGKHKEECNKFPLACPNNCEVGTVHRENMETHRKECPLEMIQCEYHNVGCDVRIARKRKRSHLDENMENHLQMTKLKLAKTEEKLMSNEEKLLSTEKRVDNLETMWVRLLQASTGSGGMTVATNWASHLEISALTAPNKTCPVYIKLPVSQSFEEYHHVV